MAAQDAELQLKVSLDLAFFKQQLTGLGQASAGYSLPIGFTFGTKELEKQIAALNRKEITIKINDSAINGATNRLHTLSNYIDTLRKAASTPIIVETKYKATGDVPSARTKARAAVATAVKGQSLVSSSSYKDLQSLYRFADAANLEFERLKRGAASSTADLQRVLAPAFRDIGKDVKSGIKSGLANADSDLAKIAANMGESLLKATKRTLGIASPSKEFKKIGEDSGEGLEQGLKIGFGEAGDVGVREIEKLFQRLQKEAKAGSAVLQAIMAGAMGGVMQLPGTRPRGAGGSIGAMIRQQRTAIQAQRQADAGSLSALMMGMMGGVIPVPSKPRAGGSIGELIQKERANARERNRPQRIENLIAALSSASGNLSPTGGVNQRPSTGGAINPGVISSGYIGRSAISPRFVNYPPTMPAAYQGRFIEPSAYASSLSTGGLSRFNMGSQTASSMGLGGVGAGGGSFVPMEGRRNVSSLSQSIQALITRAKDAAGVIKSQVTPSFKDLRAQVVDVRRSVAMQLTAEGGVMGGRYVTSRGAIKSYGQFPSEGMMMQEGITANAARFRNYSVRQNAIGGRFPLGAPYSTQSGGIGSYAFPMAGMMAPSSPLPNTGGLGAGGGSFIPTGGPPSPPPGGPPNPPPGGGGGTSMPGGMGGFGNLRLPSVGQLPGAGTINELGQEFGFAAKQVLLFGSAYKALAFLTSFPAQVQQAVASLQSFRNTLKEITPSSEEFGKSNKFILSLVDQYNIPLQSARDGFTKLYASMQPAGFSGSEIRGLFEGISMGAATFGMSADKVDRVMYAFAQMASKGQVMSEELKGQLGDVLPGALALFARAAKMNVTEFGQAMENGVFKGDAMRQLLINVGATMKEEFGKGAVGAALTFQGVMNRLQTSVIVFYEMFEPAAVAFANAFVLPLINGIRIVTDGFKELMTGQAAVTQGGSELAARIRPLIPAFEGIANNAKMVAGGALNMIKSLVPVAQLLLQIASTPVVGVLAQIYTSVLLLNGAFTLFGGRILLGLIASLGQTIASMMALNTANIVTSASLSGTRLQLMMLSSGLTQTSAAFTAFGAVARTVMMTTVVGAIAAAVAFGISEFIRLRGVMDDIAGRYKSIGDQARMMGEFGNVAGVQRLRKAALEQANTYEEIIKGIDAAERSRPLFSKGIAVDTKTAELIKRIGQGKLLQGKGGILDADVAGLKKAIELNRQARKGLEVVFNDQENKGRRVAAELDAQLNKKDLPAGAAGGDDKAERARQKALEDARKLADDKAKYEADLMKMNSLQALDLDQMQFDHWKTLQEQKYNILVAGENSWLAQAIKFQQELQSVEIARIEAVRKAREATAKAEIEAGSKSYIAGADGGGAVGGGAIGGKAMFGATGRVFNAPGWVHGHFQNMNREALVSDTVDVVMKLLSQGVSPELSSGAKFRSGMSQEQIAGLVRQGISSHKKYASGTGAIDVFVPQGTGVPVPLSGVGNLGGAAGVTGTLPGGTQLMHLDPRSASGGGVAAQRGMPASRQRAELKKDYNAALSAQSALNAKEQESLSNKNALVEAQMKITALIKQQVAEITPVEEQKLENQLVQQRIGLLSSGIFGERLDTEAKIAEVTNRATLNIGIAKKKIEENNAIAKEQKWTNEQLTDENKKQLDYISQQEKALSEYIPLLRERLGLEQRTSEAELKGQIQRATPLGGMGLAAGFIGSSADRYKEAIGRGSSKEEATRFAELQNQLTMLETRNEAIQQSILGIGDAFGEAMTTGVASLITGTASAKEAFASFLQSVGQALGQAASQMIATYIAIGIARLFAGLGGGGQGLEPKTAAGNAAFMQRTGALGFANGGVAMGGFKAFANGGVVNGPTLGLVGEGKYNEAIVPLPDGKSIPVQLDSSGIASATSKAIMDRYRPTGSAAIMEKGGAAATDQSQEAQSSPISVNYNVMSVNSMRLVTEDQFQQGLAAAASEGAKRGERNTLQSLQRYRSVRGRVGLS